MARAHRASHRTRSGLGLWGVGATTIGVVGLGSVDPTDKSLAIFAKGDESLAMLAKSHKSLGQAGQGTQDTHIFSRLGAAWCLGKYANMSCVPAAKRAQRFVASPEPQIIGPVWPRATNHWPSWPEQVPDDLWLWPTGPVICGSGPDWASDLWLWARLGQ